MYSIKSTQYKPIVDNQSTVTELMTLERVIEEGTRPNSPELISRYIELSTSYANSVPKNRVSIYLKTFSTLFKTANSTHIERQWRQSCLNSCYRPFYSLKNLALSDNEKNYIRLLKIKLATIKEF